MYVQNTANFSGYKNKKKTKQNKKTENYHFYSREILQNIARTCLRNVLIINVVSRQDKINKAWSEELIRNKSITKQDEAIIIHIKGGKTFWKEIHFTL